MFNLVDEEWIPVLWNNGQVSAIGIKEAFTRAGSIRQIAASNPMDRFAIMRFLLAVLYWCKGNPTEGETKLKGDSFPAEWFEKLEAEKDCFNLLGEGKRFFQNQSANRKKSTTELLQEIPTGNNFRHFRHSTDNINGLCKACCAMGLLRLPLFSVSGLPDLKAGINGTPPIYIFAIGPNLKETLVSNWMHVDSIGNPSWVAPSITNNSSSCAPLLDGLTTLSRKVFLHNPDDEMSDCIGCGKRDFLITTCEFQSAGELRNELWDDPHVLYTDKEPRKSLKAPDPTSTGRFRMDRPWPETASRISQSNRFIGANTDNMILVIGFSTDKAKNIDVWERTIRIPSKPASTDTAATLIELWKKESWLIEKQRIGSRSDKENSSMAATIRPHVEHVVSSRLDELLTGDPAAWDDASREYRPLMSAVAGALSPGFTSSALERRRQISRVIPDMREKKSAGKSRVKKGGKKDE